MQTTNKYGIAVDIGTTNITINLVDLFENSFQKQTTLRNPQYLYGIDIISRISYATRNSFSQRILVDLVRDAVKMGIKGLLQDHTVEPSSVSDVSIVGNTVMHHIFFDLSLDSLTRPPYKATNKQSILVDCSEVGLDFLESAQCYSPPIVESFVGSDAIAVLVASEFLDKNEIRLAIDVGTNTEVSLITPLGIWIASGASGPAFEGMVTECGIAGEIGAISKVTIDPETYSPTLSVIGDSKPRGICGTGSISIMAALLDTNLFLPRGSLNRDIKTRWLSLESSVAKYILAFGDTTATNEDIFIAQTDLRMLQQSKAAIRGVIEMVLKLAGRTADDIAEVLLTGVFGSDLDIEDVYRIGMFPRFENASITQVPNSAVDGAALLLREDNRERVEKLVDELYYIELTEKEDFKKLYLEFLPFPSK
ncbi:MAG: ASKHA domain-containing protein [Candidatus Thorarchaeota archaeon]